MFHINLKYLVPVQLKQEIRISTIIHFSILVFFIISTLIFVPRFKYNKPTVHTVQLVNLQNLRPQQITGPAPSIPKPVEPVTPKTATVKKPETKQPKVEQKIKAPASKPIMTISTKEEKIKNVKSLEERLLEKFKALDSKKTLSKEDKWEEPSSITQTQGSLLSTTGPGLSITASSPSSSNFPFAWYLDNIQNKITSCWNEPQMALEKQYIAVISFTIVKTGEITNARIKRSSGVSEFDQSGLKAIELAKPFPPLPPGYSYPDLVVNVEFRLE